MKVTAHRHRDLIDNSPHIHVYQGLTMKETVHRQLTIEARQVWLQSLTGLVTIPDRSGYNP